MWSFAITSHLSVVCKLFIFQSTMHRCKVTIQLARWFLTRRFLKFQPMRTHYGPWLTCWISNQHQKHKSGRGPSNEHFWQVWFNSVQWFQRRRFEASLSHQASLYFLLLVSISEASLSNQASLYFLLLVSISEASLSNQASLYFVVVSIH
jgi:hypothetical protein